MKKFFSDKDFFEKLLKLTLPIMLQSLMLALVAACDALMLDRVDQNSMAAVSLATQVQFIQNMIISAVLGAASILGAQYWGKKDIKTLKDIFAISLRLCGISSILFWLACVFFPRYLMLIFTNDEELISIGISYLELAGWSYLLTGISQCYLTVMKVSDHAKQTAIISSTAVVLNIILNAIFIYGLIGVPAMGVQGAAIATLISRIIELLLAVILSFKKDFVNPDLRRIFKHNAVLSADFVRTAWPLLGASLFWGIGFTSYTAFMGHLGADAAASNSVAAIIRDLVCCMCNGVASGGGILVGNELGAGKLEKGKLYGDRLVIIAFILGFISTAIMFLLTPLVMKFENLRPKPTACFWE